MQFKSDYKTYTQVFVAALVGWPNVSIIVCMYNNKH